MKKQIVFFLLRSGRPIYSILPSYDDNAILSDARLLVESVLREKGLLAKPYAARDEIH
jgi:hypothetical protein